MEGALGTGFGGGFEGVAFGGGLDGVGLVGGLGEGLDTGSGLGEGLDDTGFEGVTLGGGFVVEDFRGGFEVDLCKDDVLECALCVRVLDDRPL